MMIAGQILAVIIKSIIEISAVQKILTDFDRKDYTSGNYVIRHPNGSEFNYTIEADDKEIKSEEDMLGMMGFSLIIAGLFFGLYVICCVYSCLFCMYLKLHSSIKNYNLTSHLYGNQEMIPPPDMRFNQVPIARGQVVNMML